MRQKSVINCLKQDQKALKQYGINSLFLFGSIARKEEKKTSDVDILITLNKPMGLFTFMQLKDHLEDILDTPVDLVTEQALHPRLRKKILKESIHVL
jgi:predicted nucleotidyltransferase